jgi:ABC-type multidrug transport system fused ATPase/permease subunit
VSRKTLIDASRHVEQDLKNALIAHLQRLPIAWFDRSRTGDVTSRMTQDVELVRFVMGPLLLHGGSTLCLLPAGTWFMLSMDVPVTLASLAAFGVLFLVMRLLLPKLHCTASAPRRRSATCRSGPRRTSPASAWCSSSSPSTANARRWRDATAATCSPT